MKPKKNAFSNSSTGYGKHHRHYNSKSNKSDLNEKPEPKLTKEQKLENALEVDKNLNSGFGDYLRSPEAVEMMKLFVFANTVMLIVTMAWPNIREQYYWIRQWLESFQIGPLMQGFVLMGIIYWYSKGMISMINDYYRSEFQRKLEEVNDTTNNGPSYDVNDIENLLKVEDLFENQDEMASTEDGLSMIPEDSLSSKQETFCHGPRNLGYFMYLVGLNSSEVELECWTVKQMTLVENKVLGVLNLSNSSKDEIIIKNMT